MGLEFHRDYLLRLPLPLAQLYTRAYNAKDARGRHDNCFYLFEAMVKLGAAPQVGLYLYERRRGAERSEMHDRLLLTLAMPSLGQWVAMLRELSRRFGERVDASSHPLGHVWQQLNKKHADKPGMIGLYRRIKNGPDGQTADVTTVSLLQLFEALVVYRNSVFGHGAGRDQEFYEKEMGPLLFPAVNEAMGEGMMDLLGPRGSRLVHMTELRAVGEDRFELGMRELVGLQCERMSPLEISRREGEGIAPQQVAVLFPGWKTPLRLDPLLRFREVELGDEVLFLNRDRAGKAVEYLSYTTGRTERDPSTAPAVAAILSEVAGREVTEAQMAELAERTIADSASVEGLAPPPVLNRMGDYEILAELGRGGMGVVYLARQLSLGRLCALKMLPADLAGDPATLIRFKREMRALALCEHPNIVKVLASGTMPDGRLYYTMEYVPGCDLEHLFRELTSSRLTGDASTLGNTSFSLAVLSASKKKREETNKNRTRTGASEPEAAPAPQSVLSLPPLPELTQGHDEAQGYIRRIVKLIHDVAQALQTVHEKQIIHRDIKPGNIMLTPDGQRAVLMDFGLAKGQSMAASMTRQGGFLGTLRYAAPEQLAAATLKVGPAADVRGLGVVMWELLTRKRLFEEANDERELAMMVHERDLPRLRSIDKTFSRDLDAVVARATERRASDRIQSAGDLARYLELYLDGKPLPIRPPTLTELAKRWMAEHRGIVRATAAALVILIATIITAFILITQAKNKAIEAKDIAQRLAGEKARLADEKSRLADDNLALAVAAEKSRNLAQDQARVARGRLADLLMERGRQKLSAGEADDAGPLLAAAFLQQPDNPALRTLVHQARQRACDRLRVLRGHTDLVGQAAISPDGQWVASASADGTAKLWDARTGRLVASFDDHRDVVTAAIFSPDGKRLLTISRDHTAKLRDASAFTTLATLTGHDDRINSALFTADGSVILTCSSDGSAIVWNAADGHIIHRLLGHDDRVVKAVLLPDGTSAVTIGEDGTARVWDLRTGKPVREYKHRAAVLDVAVISAEGATPHVITGCAKGLVYDWEVGSAEEPKVIGWLGSPVSRLLVTDDQRWLVATGAGGAGRIYDAQTLQPVSSFGQTDSETLAPGSPGGAPEDSAMIDAVLSPDGSELAAAGRDGTLRLWSIPSGRLMTSAHGHVGAITSVAWSADGAQVVTTGEDGLVTLWRPPRGQLVGRLKRHAGGVESAAFDPTGKWIATGGRDGLVYLYNAQTLEHAWTSRFKPDEAWVTHIGFSADGSKLLAVSGDTVIVWDATSGKVVSSAAVSAPRRIADAFLLPDQNRILLGTRCDSNPQFARQGWLVWDIHDNKAYDSPGGTQKSIRAMVPSPDYREMITLDSGGGATLWWSESGVRQIDIDRVAAAAYFHHSNSFVIGSEQGRLQVRNRYGRTVREIDAVRGRVAALAVSDDDRWIAAGGNDGQVCVWDADDGKMIAQLAGHTGGVTEARFSPDRRVLLTAGLDGAARLWDVSTGRPLASFQEHRDWVKHASFSPDGKRLLTAGLDGAACVWQITDDADQPVAWAAHVIDHQDQTADRQGQADPWVELAMSMLDEAPSPAATTAPATAPHDQINRLAQRLINREREAGRDALANEDSPKALPHLAAAYLAGDSSPATSFMLARCMEKSQGLTATLLGHTSRVETVAFSPDGQMLLSAGWDKTARLWDARTGKLLHTLTEQDQGPVDSARFSPDGRYAMTLSNDLFVRIWDARTGALLKKLSKTGNIPLDAVFSTDSKKIVVIYRDRGVAAYDVATAQQLWTASEEDLDATTIAIDPQGRWVLTGDVLWNLADGAIVRKLRGAAPESPKVYVGIGVISDNASLFATGRDDGSIMLWDDSGKLLHNLKGHDRRAGLLRFNHDGSRLISRAGDQEFAIIWDTAGGKELFRISHARGDQLLKAAFTADNAAILTSGLDQSCRTWDAATGRPLASMEHHGTWSRWVSFDLAPDHQTVATASGDGAIRLWSLSQARPQLPLLRLDAPPSALSVSGDGASLTITDHLGVTTIWDIKSGSKVNQHATAPAKATLAEAIRQVTAAREKSGPPRPGSVAIDPSGDSALWGDEAGVIHRWKPSAADLDRAATWKAHEGAVNSVAISADGTQILTAGHDGAARLWDKSAKPVLSIAGRHQGPVTFAGFNARGNLIVTAGADNSIKVGDPRADQPQLLLYGHTAPARSASFSADQSRIVSLADDDTARLWDAATGAPIATFGGNDDPVSVAVISPDNRWLVTAHNDSSAKIWDAQTGRLITVLRGHQAPITAIAFSPDGSRLFTASSDATVRTWDLSLQPRDPDKIRERLRATNPPLPGAESTTK